MPSKRITKHIDRLILDPNNYRFKDRPEYEPVEQANVADTRVQQRTLNFILGKNNVNVKDLISSFTTNGFLDIDQIQVTEAGGGHHLLVLEGNRRIATLKYLYEEFKKGNDVGPLSESDFKSINLVLIDDEEPIQHLISMGLHHISGKKRWNAVNKSQLVSDLINKHNKTEQEVCDALGISKVKLRRGLRTLNLIQQYKQSDYGDQFESSMYTIFETVISSPEMRDWIEWSNEDMTAHNVVNLERLFGWVSQTEDIEIDEDDKERVSTKEAIISQYRQIKEIAKFIKDPRAIERMEESRSIAEAFSYSDVIGERRLRNALDTLRKEVQVAFNFSEHLTEPNYGEIQRLKDKLDRLIPSSKVVVAINDKRLASYFTTVDNHFGEIFVRSYRKLHKIKVKNLSKVNIFVGGNNLGKTSLLECFYLLSQLNDINAFLGLEKYRGKFYSGFHSKWIHKNFISDIKLEGLFNGAKTTLCLTKKETDEDIEKSGYLSTIESEGKVRDITLESSIHLYTTKAPELRFSKSQVLCPATFTSPFRYNNELLKKAHANAVKEKFFDQVIKFIQKHLDPDIEKIEMISDEGESRFMVSSSRIKKAVDITKYGEGLQRVFEIALLMVYSKDGVICIDEVDSAIHKSLLIEFTRFIQQTAEKFNVQVFLSTHSKECIDAFIKNNYPNNFIRAYALSEVDDEIACKYIEGNRLEKLIDSINFDIR